MVNSMKHADLEGCPSSMADRELTAGECVANVTDGTDQRAIPSHNV